MPGEDAEMPPFSPSAPSMENHANPLIFMQLVARRFAMLILFVNGIPSIKLSRKSEIPPRQGTESWRVIDAQGKTVAYYNPA